jgi:Double sensory domain of two-component sensor kinase
MTMRALHAFDRWRLSTRMVAASLLLLLALQVLSLAAIRGSIESNARAQLAERLGVAERIWARLLEQRAAKLGQGAALLAADYGLRSAIGSDDEETIVSALDNHGARIDAALTALLDTNLRCAPWLTATTPPSALPHWCWARSRRSSPRTAARSRWWASGPTSS